ncbi:MAG: L-rhamnonate dehydratase [Rhodospirillaceae bacterium]|nr:L-rhamnonate dehydratase [Rhodospirillaceae bacterium]
MTRITDLRTTVWEWIGPVAPMPPNFCTTPNDLVADATGSIAPFRFLGWLVVEIACEDGTVGIGNAALAPPAVKTVIDTYLRPLVMGQDPMNGEHLWQSMYRRTMAWGRKGLGMTAISAVDLALWDLKGKLKGEPVFRLLGGRTKPRIPVYASRLYSQPLEDLAREARAYVDQGFRALKLRFGWGPRDGLAGMHRNLMLVKTVREAVGEDIDVMADAYMGWNLEYARRMIRMLAPHNLRWVEEPLVPDDIAGYAELRAMGAVAISGGEHEFTLAGFRQLIEARAIDIAQFDVNRVGGITAAKKIADLCEAFDVAIIPHAGQMHNYHVTMSSYAAPIAEYFPKVPVEVGNELFWYIFDGEPVAENGAVDLRDDLPGFGLTLKAADPAEFRLTT